MKSNVLRAAMCVMFAVCSLAGLTGCEKTPLREPGVPPETLSVFYTCDTRGHILPCGCNPDAGGLARRMTALEQFGQGAKLLVDAGNVVAGARDWEIVELEYLMDGYEMMGYDAVNVGAREVSLSLEQLQNLAAAFDLFVSANVLDEAGELVFPAYRIIDVTDTYRVGVLGVVDDGVSANDLGAGLQIKPPADALAKWLPAIKEKTDLVVLLAFVDEAAMRDLAERFFEIDVIIGGKVKDQARTPIEVNKSLIVYVTEKGKMLGQLDLRFGSSGEREHEGTLHHLLDEFEDHPDITTLVEVYNGEMESMGIDPNRGAEEGLTPITASRSESANTYVHPLACKSCHPDAYDVWTQSGHANAFETLEADNGKGDCLPCHTVSYKATDGFVSEEKTPHLAMVSCDGCHGRGSYHVRFHSKGETSEKEAVLKNVECQTCHDKENSPDYDRDAYWEKISHGTD